MGAQKKKHGSTGGEEEGGGQEQEQEQEQEQDLEVLKAVAQAWHAQASIPGATKEFDQVQKNRLKHRPTRFRLEAMNMASKEAESHSWDFGQSLWDSYEIVTLSKKLEACLSVDDHPVVPESGSRRWKRRRESRNSLRNLLQRITSSSSSSSKRFDDGHFSMFDEA